MKVLEVSGLGVGLFIGWNKVIHSSIFTHTLHSAENMHSHEKFSTKKMKLFVYFHVVLMNRTHKTP